MTPATFRSLVKDEVRSFMEANQRPLGRMLGVIADQLAPAIAEQLAQGVLRQTGQLEPDERARVIDSLSEVRDYISRYGLGRKETMDYADVLLNSLDRLRTDLAIQVKTAVEPHKQQGAEVPF